MNNNYRELQDFLLSAINIIQLDNGSTYTTDQCAESLANRVAENLVDWKTLLKNYRFTCSALSQESLEFFNEVFLKTQALLIERGVRKGGQTLKLPDTPYGLLSPFLFMWHVCDVITGKVITPKPTPWEVVTEMYEIATGNVVGKYTISSRNKGADSNDASEVNRLCAIPVCLRMHLENDIPLDELLYMLRKSVKSMVQNVKELRLLPDGTFLLTKSRSGLDGLPMSLKKTLPSIPNDGSDECMTSALNSIFCFDFCAKWTLADYKWYILEYPVRPTHELDDLLGIGRYVEKEYVEIPESIVPPSLRGTEPIY